jgi:SAM-dependent methyltransferase
VTSHSPKISNPRAASDPVAYMDRVRATQFGREYKAHALELLDLKEGHSVLDVGCGPGDDLLEMERRVGASGRAVGIDFHEVMIEAARSRAAKRGSAAEFHCMNVLESDFESESFDRCHADRVLQLIPDRLRAIREMIRLLRPGGHLVASLPDSASWVLDFGLAQTTAKILAGPAGWGGTHLINAFKDAGLVDPVYAPCANISTDFAEFDASTPLREIAARAHQNGLIDAAELDAWLNDLEEAVERDRFTICSTFVVIRGSRPSEKS